jgi:ribosomal protein S6
VAVDPISSVILRIELADARKAENWKRHWKQIEKNGHYAAYLVCDEGQGLCSAKAEALPDVMRQSDTYHAIAHQLGLWVERLEKAAYKAIDTEYRCFDKLDSARSDSVINKRIDDYEKAKLVAEEKMELCGYFQYLYRCLIAELKVFGEDGRLRDRAEAEHNLHAGLDLVESLDINKLNKEIKKVRRTLPDLLNYFDVAHDVVQKLENSMDIDHQALRALCLAWQWNKGAIKSKKAGRTRYCKENIQFCLEYAEGHLQESYEDVKERVYGELDTIVQSSALVECINSIIRPYLNGSKNHISQETLNLIMFYHNHRRYKSGKRKGKTPMEILTGKDQQEDWITLILDHVEKKDPSILPTH